MSDALLDILIPVHGRHDWLLLCLQAIKNWTKNPYRITIVDNLNSDQRMLDLFERVKLGEFGPAQIVPGLNKSFSNSINLAVRATQAPNLVILNSDALVTEGWDTHFLSDLADKKVGITGARSNAIAGLQGDSSGISSVMDPPFLCFVCVAMRREVFDAVGGMDEERFDGWSSEDLDLSWSVKKAGGRLKISNAYVMHGLSRSLSQTVGGVEARIANDKKYNARLFEKWGIEHVIESSRLRPRVMLFSFSAEEMTRVTFTQALMGLRRGTVFDLDYAAFIRMPIHLARQSAAQSVLNMNKGLRDSGQLTFSHVAMIDDDAAEVPPDALMRLLAHKKDVVGVVAYQRGVPYNPCVFELAEDQRHVTPIEVEHTGLREVDAVGFHMVLIKVSVFERLQEFYVNQEKAKGVTDHAQLQRARERGRKFYGAFEDIGEDLRFCERCREAGIKIHVDSDLILGHTGPSIVVNEAVRKQWKAQQATGQVAGAVH